MLDINSRRTSVTHSPNLHHHTGQSHTVAHVLHRQHNIYMDAMVGRDKHFIKLKKESYRCIKSSKISVLYFGLFTIVAMIIGILTVYFTSYKSSTKCELTFHRTMESSIVDSSRSRSIAVGDLNQDHYMDFVVANSGTHNIGVFISHGNGSFASQTTYSTGQYSRPYSVAISHFNNDSHLDIAVANYGTNSICILFGNGNGTFSNTKSFPLGSSRPIFIAVADFNKDHYMDIVVVNNGTNTISILFGYTNGSFQAQGNYSTDYDSLPASLAIGDFNNDTHLDIVVANSGTDNIGIFINNGNGTFANQQLYTTTPGSMPLSIAVGDFNNDEQLDIVAANYGHGDIGIFFGNGNATFQPQIPYQIASHSYPQYVTVADINKDNRFDIVIVDSEKDQINVLPGYGNGTFATVTTYETIKEAQPFCVALADFNNNNQTDFVVVDHGSNDVLVLTDYSKAIAAQQTTYHDGKSGIVSSVAVNDFNNDHILDIVFNVGNYIVIRFGLGGSHFAENIQLSTGDKSITQYVCTGDLNNDKHIDIVIADLGSDGIDVFFGHGNGSFAKVRHYSTGIYSRPYWVALGDLNQDNHLDMVTANKGTDSVGILLGMGHNTFTEINTYFIGADSAPYSVAIGDINNDKHLDIAVANGNDRITILLGYGNGSFIIWMTYSTGIGSSPGSLALGHFNRDHYLDIVVANTLNDNIGIFLGYGNGTFAPQTIYSTNPGSQPYYVIIKDFNNDNISDIASTNFGTNEIMIFFGYGNGSFSLTETFSTGLGSKPFGITTITFDNNTQLELVVIFFGTGAMAILIKYDAAEFTNETVYLTDFAPRPFSITMGDFNNDNRTDMAVANSGVDTLSILFGFGNGTFNMKMSYSVGTDYYPQYVMACDVNQDNYLDIVSVNYQDDSISVIMGYGNGSFMEQIIYPTNDGSEPYAVSSGDFNKDNRLDLVVANKGTHNIGILFGYDYTSFRSQGTYSATNNTGPQGMIVSDFNNDHILDIAATFKTSHSLCIFLGYSNGSFTNVNVYSTGTDSSPRGIAVGDFNNDTQMDIVVTNTDSDNIGIFLSYGNGDFAPMISYTTGQDSYPIDVNVGDFNNDTHIDFVVANRDGNSLGIFLGYGNGSFSTMIVYSLGELSRPYAVTVDDLNHDGRLDIVVANYRADGVGILLGYGNGTFTDQIQFSCGYSSGPRWLMVTDFNNDHQLDIATTNYDTNSIGILLGFGNGSFASVTTYSAGDGSLPQSINVGDFNNDNKTDIAVANYGANAIVVLFGMGDGTFLLGKAYSTGAGSLPYASGIGDFNKDGQLDVAVTNYLTSNIQIFLGSSNEPFAGVTTYGTGTGSHPHSVVVADFNEDGQLDIAVANYGTDTVGVLLGRKNRAFKNIELYTTGNGSAPYSIAVADFNNDTHLDIVVTNSETANILILFGLGNGSFISGMIYSTGPNSRPYTVTTSDFNNDNITDIAIANSGTSNIYLFYGFGNGTFGNDTSYSLGYEYHPYSLAAGDLDRNGWMDIAIACYSTNHVETLLKLC